jgi:hypothetical protein
MVDARTTAVDAEPVSGEGGLTPPSASGVGAPEAAASVVRAAAARGLTVRVLGGVAIAIRCPAACERPFARAYRDIDFVGRADEGPRLESLFAELGFTPERRFNSLNGHRRLMFRDEANGRTIDVLLDRFEMCHRIDFRHRLTLEELTLSAADLLLTKLQVVQAEEKDLLDALALLVDHELGGAAGELDADHVARLCAADWGLYRTAETNLTRLTERAERLDEPARSRAQARLAALREQIAREPKSARWRARARVGTKVRWYRLPEEVG